MNREIKFRCWDNNQKKIIYFPLSLMSQFIGYELMQYTGLKDKNEKEIYEGDIVKLAIIIQEKNWKKNCRIVNFIISPYRCGWNVGLGKNWEVIGNMWENPELLK